MASPFIVMRDPVLYRIKFAEHHQTGNKWCIYPMYDYAHGQSDSIEQITHSICTLEFDVHRPLYDWFIQALEIYPSHQYEFARLNLTYTMMSKRKLLKLVQEGAVMGWDDPRMPTICALRRKGYTPASVRNFAEMVGVAKRDNVIDLGKLEYCVREDLNKIAERRMAVLNPLKVVITNYEEGKTYPVAFLIHGGPQGSFGNGWSYRWNPQTYAGQGYAVVMIDFHGSTGYGQAFTDSLNGQWVAAWHLVSAGSIIAAMPPVLMFFLMQKHFIAGLTLGAVK